MITSSGTATIRQLWLYRQTSPRSWSVGHFDAAGTWVLESEHARAESAAARVHWLNGGAQQRRVDRQTSAEAVVAQLRDQVQELTVDRQQWVGRTRRLRRRLREQNRRLRASR